MGGCVGMRSGRMMKRRVAARLPRCSGSLAGAQPSPNPLRAVCLHPRRTEGEYPVYGNDDDRVDSIARQVRGRLAQGFCAAGGAPGGQAVLW